MKNDCLCNVRFVTGVTAEVRHRFALTVRHASGIEAKSI
jgi:hypothetical protein